MNKIFLIVFLLHLPFFSYGICVAAHQQNCNDKEVHGVTMKNPIEKYKLIKPNDPAHEELFETLKSGEHSPWFVGVKTTGIVCRFGCPAPTLKSDNTVFSTRLYDLIGFGYRECKKCHPLSGQNKHSIAQLIDIENSFFPEKSATYEQNITKWVSTWHQCEISRYINMKRVNYILANSNVNKVMPGQIYYQRFWSPLGPMVACATLEGVSLLEFSDRIMLEAELLKLQRHFKGIFVNKVTEHLSNLFRQLDEYFSGVRKEFSVPLNFVGSDFEQKVWTTLKTIPFGKTTTYGELAQTLELPEGARAVGAANGKNSISILVPCHRVIASDGSLGGYGGGLERKYELLRIEKKFQLSLQDKRRQREE